MSVTSPQIRDAAAARTRLKEIDAELRRLRGAPPTPLARPEPLSPEAARAVLSLLAESAVHHVVVNEADHARRAIGDAIALMTETTDPATAARAALLMGETLIELDSAKHAEDQLQRAVLFYDRVGDRKLASRARLALGRAMVLLDQPTGMDLLQQVLDDYLATADVAGVARVQTIFAELNRGADAAETIRAGYGRSVSMLPLPPTKPPPGRGGSMPPAR